MSGIWKVNSIIIVFSLFFSFCLSAQNADSPWAQRVLPMVNGCTTQYGKAKAIYDWVAHNIAYDPSFTIRDAEVAWQQKKGICDAYGEIFVQLASHCGLEAEKIGGVSRNGFYPKGDGSHAWVKVNTEKGWILLDPTWGAGDLVNGKFVFNYKEYWFDVNPWWMFFTHYPENPQDQLLPQALARAMYDKMPDLTPEMAWWCWEPEKTVSYYWSNPAQSAPVRFLLEEEWKEKLRVTQVPSGELQLGYQYPFQFQSLDSNLLWAVTGTANKDIVGDFSTGAYIAPKSAGTIVISVFDRRTNMLHDLLEYKVRK